MNEREIFAAAMERPTEIERQAFLSEACDGAMRQRIERLIKEQAQLGSFLAHPPLESDSGLLCGISPTMMLGNDSTFDYEQEATSSQATGKQHQAQDCDDEILLSYLEPATREGTLGCLGHHEVLDVIGKGSFGTVLRAFDTKLERIVAIKVLAPEIASMSPARKRFLREARTSAQIRHANVVTIHSVEETPIPYIVMEYIPGRTLQQRLDEHGPLDLPTVLRLGKQIADGLAAAHAKELIHRDIKPGNILLEEDAEEWVKITDFGLARTVDDASLTQSGIIAGTPMYMAPEQAHGHKLDQRADLFSFGSVLYKMLSGRPPFRASSTIAVLKRVTEDTPRPIQEIIPETPAWMCKLVGHLHAKDPSQRYGSAREVSELLATCAKDFAAGRIPQIPDPVKTSRETREATQAVSTDNHRRSTRQSPLVRITAAVLILLGVLGITEATGVTHLALTVIRLRTGSGTLVIETDDPNLKIAIDGEEVTITGGGVEELILRPGEYKVAAMKDGKPVRQELVSITRNGRTVVQMSLEGMNTTVSQTRPDSQPSTLDSQSGLLHDWPADAPAPAIAPFNAEQAKQYQESWAKYLGVPVEYTNSIGMTFRLIPPGKFLMGSTPEEIEAALKLIRYPSWRENIESEGPQHNVVITKPIYVGVTEVTQAQYEHVMGTNPSTFSTTGSGQDAVADLDTSNHPVETVSWNDAVEFCSKLSQQEQRKPFYFRSDETVTPLEGTGYRLPTDAEWEYACRAGTTMQTWSGDEDRELMQVAWSLSSGSGRTHVVGELKDNPFGLRDVYGNVWEWVQDGWDPNFSAQFQEKIAIDPSSPFPDSSDRPIRGGDWNTSPREIRSSFRLSLPASHRPYYAGFRVVLVAESVSATEPPTTSDGAISFVESLGGKVFRNDNAPGKPVTRIDLAGTQVTDAGLKELDSLTTLELIDLRNTQSTDAGIGELQKALPMCQILK